MLLSTRILLQFCTRTTLVVNIPNEDSRAMDVATLFRRILDHFYDSSEPFVPTPADYDASIRATIGGSQQGDFQDLPLTVCVAVVQFGVYMKAQALSEMRGCRFFH